MSNRTLKTFAAIRAAAAAIPLIKSPALFCTLCQLRALGTCVGRHTPTRKLHLQEINRTEYDTSDTPRHVRSNNMFLSHSSTL